MNFILLEIQIRQKERSDFVESVKMLNENVTLTLREFSMSIGNIPTCICWKSQLE